MILKTLVTGVAAAVAVGGAAAGVTSIASGAIAALHRPCRRRCVQDVLDTLVAPPMCRSVPPSRATWFRAAVSESAYIQAWPVPEGVELK